MKLWYGPATLGARLIGASLLPVEALFRAGVALRTAAFDRGLLRAHQVKARVISIGNLNVGGAGKTPMVILAAERLRRAGKRVVVLTRGHGRASREEVLLQGAPVHFAPVELAGDEPRLIARRCPGVPVLVGGDRVALAQRAIRELAADTLLLDDGFQHRRLARDVDLVVIDGEAGFGNGHLLPRGPLREPPSALRRATLACVRVHDDALPRLELPIPTVVLRYRCSALVAPDGVAHPPETLGGQSVIALAAIARPDAFVRSLVRLGATVSSTGFVADHRPFPPALLDALRRGGARIVTTEKDAERLPPEFPAWVLRMELEVVSGAELLDAALGTVT